MVKQGERALYSLLSVCVHVSV